MQVHVHTRPSPFLIAFLPFTVACCASAAAAAAKSRGVGNALGFVVAFGGRDDFAAPTRPRPTHCGRRMARWLRMCCYGCVAATETSSRRPIRIRLPGAALQSLITHIVLECPISHTGCESLSPTMTSVFVALFVEHTTLTKRPFKA